MEIRVKRAYDPPAESDGVRILVDHLWPRGVRKDTARIKEWFRDISPSTELRKWFGHDPEKWSEFRRRYFKELAAKKDLVKRLVDLTDDRPLTLVYATKETRYNNAVALKEYLETHAKPRKRAIR